MYVQSAYSMPDRDKSKQEQFPLLSVGDTFSKMIITADNVPEHYNDNGVKIMNIMDFLTKTSVSV